MPDQSVEVTFDPNADPQFTFMPATVTMTRAGRIVLHRRPQSAQWTFVSARVDDGTSAQFSAAPNPNGNQLIIRDAFTDEWKRYHKYTITVEFEWGTYSRTYESPDPVIVNDPGSRDVAIAPVKGGERKGGRNK